MNSLFDLTGRSALVTGAAGGIGSAVAEALATAGAAVLVTDIDKDAATAVAQRISEIGKRADSCALDVADRASADAAVAQAAALTNGVLHILINNAGVTAPAMFADISEDNFERLLGIHVMGTFRCSQAALPFLPTDGTGRIINDHLGRRPDRNPRSSQLFRRQGRHHRHHQIAGARVGPQEHPGERAGPPGRHAHDGDHPHQREIRREHDGANPAAPLGAAERDRGRVRLPGLRRGVLHHWAGPTG